MRALLFLFFLDAKSPDNVVEDLRKQGATAVKLHMVQLDGDAPLEAVIQYELANSGVHARVLNESAGEWKEAGTFNSWWNYVPADAARFLEFRETVEPGVKDILVRTRNGGTEDSRTVLEIFRMRDGQMLNVLTLKEHETAMEHPSNDVFTTSARLDFAPGRIKVETLKDPGAVKACVVYTWNESSFRFEADRQSARRSCS